MAELTLSSSYGRILSVDSEVTYNRSIAEYLEDSGFTVYEASNGVEALAIFKEKHPDLILSTLQMPKMGGLELLEAIKKESPETPVIIMSDKEQISDLMDALRLGALDCIAKPIENMAVLEHAVCRALERGRLETENKNYRLQLEEKNLQLTQNFSQLKEDQQAGEKVQQQLFPETRMTFSNLTFCHRVLPSLYLSGDFVDYFQITPEKIGFYIIDVSGHGASSAFVTVLLKSLMDQMIASFTPKSQIILHPDKILQYVSNKILEIKLGKYLTMIYGVMDINKNTFDYSVGGHYPNPIMFHNNQSFFLEGSGFPLGVIKDAKFSRFQYPLPEKFTLAMFSDGIFEMIVGKNLQQKESVLLDVISKSPFDMEEILSELGIKEGDTLPDDIAVLLINRK